MEFLRLRTTLTTSLPPASGARIDAAASKLRQRLVSSVMFAQAEVEVTADPERLLIAMVRYRPGTPERQVSSFLEAVWITELRLDGLDAFNFLVEPGHVELEAATGDQASGFFLSLQLIALEGGAEDFEGAEDQGVGMDPESQPLDKAVATPTKRRWFRTG